MALLNLQDITIAHGGPALLDGINLQIHPGERICLLGRNGSGKTTLMKIINRTIEPDSGSIICDKNLRSALLAQEVPQNVSGTVYKILADGIVSLDEFQHKLTSLEEQKLYSDVEKTLSLLSLDPDWKFENLSAGMKRRVLLGRALACDPDIFLLDEPTNHLDMDSIQWLENFLFRYKKTIVFVTHDRIFLQKVANRIIEIDRGKLYDWKCDYNTFLQRKEAWLESEETRHALFDKKLSEEETWVRKGIKARRTRNEGRVRALIKMRDERRNRRVQQGTVKMELQEGEKSGKLVVEAVDISFGYSDADIIKNFSIEICRGDRVGIIGPNGCGKSTLIKILLNSLSPRQGSIKHGMRLDISYFDQLRNQLDESLSVRDNVADGNDIIDFNGSPRHIIGYLQDFLFAPDRIDVSVSALSGGEKNRLLLAKLFTKPANLLVLDEPTNDLDLETVELLEDLLMDFKGTLLLISHDRAFLNNVVTSTLIFEGKGFVVEYEGGYDEYLNRKKVEVKEKPDKKERAKKAIIKNKMSYKEKLELESLPGLLEQKEKRKNDIYQLMADPAFYKAKGDAVADLKKELLDNDQEIEILNERWYSLEEKNRNE